MKLQMKTHLPPSTSLASFMSTFLIKRVSADGAKPRPPPCATPPTMEHRHATDFPLSRLGMITGASIFAAYTGALAVIYFTMPNLDPHVLKFPNDLQDLRMMKEHLSLYTRDYTLQVLMGYVATYVFMQTFMIPGTIFFSLLAGALFGVYKGIMLVIFSATAGASCCFFMSKLFGAPIAVWFWPRQIGFFQAEVAKHKGKLLNYMLFLRVTPTLPNTFINFASPIVGIPYHTFFLATVIGLTPASFITVRAGLTLGQLKSVGDLYDVKTVAGLFILGVCFIVPTILCRQARTAA